MIYFGRLFASLILLVLLPIAFDEQSMQSLAQKKQGDKSDPKHIFTGPAPVHPVDILLTRPTSRSITCSILAYKNAEGFIRYGTESGGYTGKTESKKFSPEDPVEIILKDLQADKQYFYKFYYREPAVSEYTSLPEGRFHTARSRGEAFTFTIQSDSHLDQGTRIAVYEKTLANVLADNPDFHIDVGDTFMTDKYERFKDALPQYFAQRYYLGQVANSAALFLVLGNHDGEKLDRYDGTSDCMSSWSCLTRKKYFPNPYPDGFYTGNKTELKSVGRLENYYAWEWGDALFIALDPFWKTNQRGRGKDSSGNWGRTLGEEQFKWLEKTLSASKAKYKFVFIHHLVGGLDESARGGSEAALLYEWGGRSKEGQDEFKQKRPGWSTPIHQLLLKYNVSAVFHGHDHFYARQELDNILYLMVPQPGHPGYDKLRNADEYGYIRGTFLPPSGHLRVTVTPEKASIEYVRAYVPSAESKDRRNREIADVVRIKPVAH
ncbi:metallophosphoesterase [Telmatocola sphagniphila]|uniref:Metallophosphoesterase n=1 Tax=Telmatocola sphagniphila TaxID=1123043 RepID=A0A8E6B873_9BACT|nr:metallophosphoesterase [Telmatocola sphagniphila]QVL33541.1 metallophosphoesterase [Telmatocola sphagniphila]